MACITIDTLIETLPALKGLDTEQLKSIAQQTTVLTLLQGKSLFREGDSCKNYYFVITGMLRIQKVTPSGNELILYRLKKGQECNLTNTCLLGGEHYNAEAVAEVPSMVAQLPKAEFDQALAKIPEFRETIFQNIRHGMNSLLNLVQEVAFDNMDHRLAVVLLKHGSESPIIKTTHQALASELGTAREVVSRLLKEFERHGWVKLSRGKIEVIDPQQLANV